MMKILKKVSFLFVLCAIFFQNNVFANKVLNIAFIGILSSGKTALKSEATGCYFDYEDRTLTRATTQYNGNLRYFDKDITCNLFDTSGEDKVRNEIITYRLKNADIAVITIDSSENAKVGFNTVYKENFTKWIDVINQVHPNLPILLVATKIDDAIDVDKLSNKLKKFRDAYEDTCDFEYVATSARKRINLGKLTDSNDLGENFWGKIRYMIKQRNMYHSLKEDGGEIKLDKDPDNPDKKTGKCPLL